jgi:hypothetical protein
LTETCAWINNWIGYIVCWYNKIVWLGCVWLIKECNKTLSIIIWAGTCSIDSKTRSERWILGWVVNIKWTISLDIRVYSLSAGPIIFLERFVFNMILFNPSTHVSLSIKWSQWCWIVTNNIGLLVQKSWDSKGIHCWWFEFNYKEIIWWSKVK